ncbi:S66 peptidase family protein [Constantimarinum furrinae]|uniref:Muramoyltetrapeptide carboxypeptidase n=1 Tax=Constantimarinum furrinae TaxID=2562285 RepID=A0A7G8PTI1_9FLAO|nr:LD-carboxypeptidase [Constantimarinum furrinae]QNJ97647.1 muramoyltetrapeptide carboxypeptidase [Constantimarinum furrinae]
MITPPLLNEGDTVAIVSTARKITKTEIAPLLDLLKSWGLNVVLGKSIDASDHQYAGDDALRASDLQQQLDDPNIKAIWCARGGYGTVRLIDALDFSVFKSAPKWIIGYSDVTVLHAHIHNFGIESLHANMAIDILTKSSDTRETVKEALFEGKYTIQYTSTLPQNRTGMANGQLVGGNLSLLSALLGSPSAISTKGKILFIEDLDEMLYHIDRMMINLKRNGLLKDIAGLIVGGMNDMRDNSIPFGKTPVQIIAEAVAQYHFPVCFGFPAGHIDDNRALIMGRKCSLEVGSNLVTLRF